jgi:folate-binding protein YgfZ
MATVTPRVAARPRDYVRVAGPDAEDFLQRMLSNDVTAAPCRAMLLTPKARLIAPLVVVRRADEDFLLLTEPGLGEPVAATLLRARFAAKVEIEPEVHTSVVVFGEDGGIPNEELGELGAELLDSDVAPTLSADEVERIRIESAAPAWGKELDETILPAEAGLDVTHVSFTKGCYPGQEPIARLHHRGKVNRSLRALEVEGAEPGAEIRHGDKVVGRVTSAVTDRALGYVRVEVPDDAELAVGPNGKTARVLPA